MKLLHSSGLETGEATSASKTSISFKFPSGAAPIEALKTSMTRWYDPTLGEWMSEDPVGFADLPEHLRKYVGQ